MARTRTLLEMRDDAYKLADQEGFTDRFPAAEVTRYINQGVAELWDLLIASNGYTWAGKPWLVQNAPAGDQDEFPLVEGSVDTSIALLIKITQVIDAGVAWRFSWSVDGTENWLAESVLLEAGETIELGQTGLTVTGPTDGFDIDVDDSWTWTFTAPSAAAIGWNYLPDDFYKVNTVAISTNGENRLLLSRLPNHGEEWLRGCVAGDPEFFNIRGQYIEFFPKPSADYLIHMNYVPTAPALVADTDAFNGINGWEEYPSVYAARRMVLKDADIESVNLLQQELNKLTARIKGLASDRDIGQAKRVQDTRGALAWRRNGRRRLPRA